MISVAALVPMRHSSERVPGKNYRSFNGRPLYEHIVTTLLAVPAVREVIIDTDSPVILERAGSLDDRVRLIERPEDLRAGDVPMNDIIRHDLRATDQQWILQTHSTNPLLTAATIIRALEVLEARSGEHDSLFSVTARHVRLWWPDGRPLNHDPTVLLRTQDLPPVLEENSNLYVFDRDVFTARNNRIGARPLLFEIDAAEAWDIDEELDFVVAESLHRMRSSA